MKDKKYILSQLEKKILILDGAMGTELVKRGMPTGVCPETWCIANPGVVSGVYGDYVEAGSDVIYTATFGANYYKLGQYNEKDVTGINARLAEIARDVAGGRAIVAGDIAPFGKFVAPFGEISFEDAVKYSKLQIKGLLSGGVDMLVIETMMDIQEARAALIAARESCDLFVMVTMTFDETGYTLNGTDPQAAIVTLQSLGADAVGCNCSAGPVEMQKMIQAMRPLAKVPLVAKPNAGMPRLVDGKTVFRMDAQEFASKAAGLASSGAALIGGCCGTTPLHIKALANALRNRKPDTAANRTPAGRLEARPPAALSSSRKALVLGDTGAIDQTRIIGERINPTGKKALQAALREKNYSLAVRMAREQALAGASLLDVNAGMPGIDERETLCGLVNALATKTDLVLVLDSSSPETLEAALRIYPGRALVNSVSAEPSRLEALLPVAAFYGAMLIALPIEGREIPETAQERVRIVKKILAAGAKHGLRNEDFVIDGLVMAAAGSPAGPAVTLETIGHCSGILGLKTVTGLSNVSFGMPSRPVLNAAFLAQAVSRGLTFAIANPSDEAVVQMRLAADFLANRKGAAARFLARYGNDTGGKAAGAVESIGGDAAGAGEKVRQAVIEGARDEIVALIKQALDAGTLPLSLVGEHMIPAINSVGNLFAEKKYFLPQLLSSAETMETGFAFLKPMLDLKAQTKRGKIILATVEGDIHDIGKNIVALLLRNHGFDVVDLGKDVSSEKIVAAAKKENPDIIGLSALMTTTMVKMKEVIAVARDEGLDIPFMVGGAVVDADFAGSVGAVYAKDGVEAASKAAWIIINRRK